MVRIVHPQAFHPFFPHAGAGSVADLAPAGKGAVIKCVVVPAQHHFPPAIQNQPQQVLVLCIGEFVSIGSFTGARAFQVGRIYEMQGFRAVMQFDQFQGVPLFNVHVPEPFNGLFQRFRKVSC